MVLQEMTTIKEGVRKYKGGLKLKIGYHVYGITGT
jgi:hypothetical protein